MNNFWDEPAPVGSAGSAPDAAGDRSAPASDLAADVCIIGGGLTGLWTAYYLARTDPSLRIVILEKETVGFGASGRNGGWCSALFPRSATSLARTHGFEAAVAMRRAMVATVAEVGRVTALEGIDCDFAEGGTLTFAMSPVQVAAAHAEVAVAAHFGVDRLTYTPFAARPASPLASPPAARPASPLASPPAARPASPLASPPAASPHLAASAPATSPESATPSAPAASPTSATPPDSAIPSAPTASPPPATQPASGGSPAKVFIHSTGAPTSSSGHPAGALGVTHDPACARLHPGKLVRGLAAVVERLGVRIHEHTEVTAWAPGRVTFRPTPPVGPATSRSATPPAASPAASRSATLPADSLTVSRSAIPNVDFAASRSASRTNGTNGGTRASGGITGTVAAARIVIATEAYGARLQGVGRRILPLYSLMIATEPLPDEFWQAAGIAHGNTFSDYRHLLIYGQRTADNRFAFGGRGARYHWGSSIRPSYDSVEKVFDHLASTLVDLFPDAFDAEVTHRWGGPIGVPRDWHASASFNPRTGIAYAGGYVGDGLSTTNLAGRTLTALMTGTDPGLVSPGVDLTRLPWVNHLSPRWEPEPLRFAGANLGLLSADLADTEERLTGRPSRTARLLGPLTGH